MGFTRKLITTTTCDFGLLLAIGLSALVVAITLLLAEWWTCSLVMLWLASVNFFNSWRAWRRLNDPLPDNTWFRLRELLVPNALITFVFGVASRAKIPQFSLRTLLLSFLICAVIFGGLKVLDDQRKIARRNERRNELRERLAALESERPALEWRATHWWSMEDASLPAIARYKLQQSNLEIKRIRSELGEPESIEEDLVRRYKLQDRERTIEQIRNEIRESDEVQPGQAKGAGLN